MHTEKITSPTNILFCGIGGQGVLKASEICGIAAMLSGFQVRKSEVHGMSQRGGSVRFGKTVHSPLIMPGKADILVSFHAEETERLKHFLKKGGLDLTLFIDRAVQKVPDKRFVNTFIMGVLSAFLPLSTAVWLAALAQVFTRAQSENQEAFLNGLHEGKSHDIQRKN